MTSSSDQRQIKLLGYIKISGEIEAKTGLHIGGTSDSIDKGGIDSPVIKNPVTNEPYIPGSSLRGRMRSLLEKKTAAKLYPMTSKIWMEVYPEKKYQDKSTSMAKKSEVCRVFGDSSCKEAVPSVLIVRDALYNDTTRSKYMQDRLPITEAKIEIAVDRITSHALPRTIERVPAGACFEFEIIYKVQTYDNGEFVTNDIDGDKKSNKALHKDIDNILSALLEIQEYDGLGGNTSRGHGRVQFCFHTLKVERYGGHGNAYGLILCDAPRVVSASRSLTKEDILDRVRSLTFSASKTEESASVTTESLAMV